MTTIEEQIETLKSLPDRTLIDVVKNYRQYGYDHRMRAVAIVLLEERGVSLADLESTGNLENQSYNHAIRLYKTFSSQSTTAFVLWGLLLLMNIANNMGAVFSSTAAGFLLAGNIILLILFLAFLIQSFQTQTQFFRAIGEKSGADTALLYLLLGMPLYIFLYFYTRRQMKEKMKDIR